MIRVVIGVFFFGVLGLALGVAVILCVGLQVVEFTYVPSWWVLFGLLGISCMSLWLGFRMQTRKIKRSFWHWLGV